MRTELLNDFEFLKITLLSYSRHFKKTFDEKMFWITRDNPLNGQKSTDSKIFVIFAVLTWVHSEFLYAEIILKTSQTFFNFLTRAIFELLRQKTEFMEKKLLNSYSIWYMFNRIFDSSISCCSVKLFPNLWIRLFPTFTRK